MDKNRTLIVLVLDESGSMEPLRGETIASVNSFIAEQKKVAGDCSFVYVPFASSVKYPRVGPLPLSDVSPLTVEKYSPGGWTALLDAIGISITETGRRLAELDEADRPGKVIVVVMTDGHENYSTKYRPAAKVKAMIEHQTEKYGWKFLFLGAGLDAIDVGASYGFQAVNTMSWEPEQRNSTVAAYASISKVVGEVRVRGMSPGFTVEDRLANAPTTFVPASLVPGDLPPKK